jgi:calcineurin-like phosphoesterase family protein
MRTFFTADSHFGHENIIKHCARPFASVEEMDDCLIANWNSVVRKDDRVIHLGDFAYKGDPKRLTKIFSALNGPKFLVIGNHDGRDTLALPWAAPPVHILHLTIDGQKIVACHYSMRTWSGARHGAIQLYGHSHGRLPGNSLSSDVGVDCFDFFPQSLAQIRVCLSRLPAAVDPEADPEPDSNDNDGGLDP